MLSSSIYEPLLIVSYILHFNVHICFSIKYPIHYSLTFVLLFPDGLLHIRFYLDLVNMQLLLYCIMFGLYCLLSGFRAENSSFVFYSEHFGPSSIHCSFILNA